MTEKDIHHLVIGLVWFIVVAVAILFYITDGNALRRRAKDSKPKQSKSNDAEDL